MKNKNTVYLTQEGLDNLKKELDDLINVRRPENVQAIKEARALGDLSENAEYDAARNEQAVIEARIKQLEKMLENVSIISDVSTDSVSLLLISSFITNLSTTNSISCFFFLSNSISSDSSYTCPSILTLTKPSF